MTRFIEGENKARRSWMHPAKSATEVFDTYQAAFVTDPDLVNRALSEVRRPHGPRGASAGFAALDTAYAQAISPGDQRREFLAHKWQVLKTVYGGFENYSGNRSFLDFR